MHVTLVHVRVKPEEIATFIAATRANHQGALAEPGNRRRDFQNRRSAARVVVGAIEDAISLTRLEHAEVIVVRGEYDVRRRERRV